MEYPQAPADYKIVHFEAGDFKDDHNNTWCNVLFEGYTSEQIRWVVKDPTKPKVGDVVYGHFTNETSKAGKSYIRFRTDQKSDWKPGGASRSDRPTKPAYQKSTEEQEHIARSVALKASVDFCSPVGSNMSVDDVLSTADTFLAWLQGGQGSSESKPIPGLGKESQGYANPAASGGDTQTPTGYDKFKQTGAQLRRDERDEFNDMRNGYSDDEPLPEFPGDM